MGTHYSRRQFLTISGAAGMTLALGGLFGCSSGQPAASNTAAAVNYENWEEVLKAAKGQTVSWYGWGGSEPRNNWINSVLAPRLKEKYDVTLDLVGMDINDVLTQLSGEMTTNKDADGTIDYVWINGENFFSTKENGYLWGPFTKYLPNYTQYCDDSFVENSYDFGCAVEGFEAPYGRTQFAMWVDSAKVPNPPKTPEEFLEFCKQHPGQISYPEPGDFTGTAFIESLIEGVVGKEKFEKLSTMLKPNESDVKAIVEPGLEYLRSLNPYLWNAGATFPADSKTVATMFADGELLMGMGYGDPQAKITSGELPNTVKAFMFDSGTVGNTNFMAIPANAPHKAAALVAINEVISPEMQLDQYKVLGNMTVLDTSKLSAEQRKAFDDVELGSSQIPLQDRLDVRAAEAAGPVVPILEKLWHDEVVGK